MLRLLLHSSPAVNGWDDACAQVSAARGLACVVTATQRITLLDLEADDAGSDEEGEAGKKEGGDSDDMSD